jgi:pathogenesis-related protein 1
MPAKLMMAAGLIGFALSCAARQTAAQTIELKSVELTVLTSGEREKFLAAHNVARKAVGVEPLAWSDELGEVARQWLGEQQDQLIDKAKEGWAEGRIVLPDHRPDDKYGENIAGWAGRNVPGAERVVTWWLEEKKAFDKLNADGEYKFGDEKDKTETDAEGNEKPNVVGHYTQIVWRSTSHLGAAKLTFQLVDDEGHVRTYVAIVCNYDPAGNISGEKPF